MSSAKRFGGKVFIVTGASSGIGEVIAKALATDGAHVRAWWCGASWRGGSVARCGVTSERWGVKVDMQVVLAARRVEKLEAVVAEITGNGGSASAKQLDVLDYGTVVRSSG